MKAVIGVLILLCLFGAATTWQDHWLGLVREEASHKRSDRDALWRAHPSGWATVVIGGSCAPLELGTEPTTRRHSAPPPSSPTSTDSKPSTDTRVSPYNQSPAANQEPIANKASGAASASGEYPVRAIVRRGQNMSTLCETHYGTSRPDLVDAVSRYNHLQNPHSIREGQALEFPSVEQLGLGEPLTPAR